MESEVRRDALSSGGGDCDVGNIRNPLSAMDDSVKEVKECVTEDETYDGDSEIRKVSVRPEILQELVRTEQNGCVTAELNFEEGIGCFHWIKNVYTMWLKCAKIISDYL
jgi:hypothetical protein